MEEKEQLDGFSSDSEVREEELIQMYDKTIELDKNIQQARLKIPPPQQLKTKSYSLIPDMANGWIPKVSLPSPIPLIYQSQLVNQIVYFITQSKISDYQMIYLGNRPSSTYFSYQEKYFNFPYSHLERPKNKQKFPFKGMKSDNYDYIFDSNFQSGNLDMVVKRNLVPQYDLYIRVDTNTRGHCQWYYFTVKNKVCGNLRLNICNMQKSKNLYSRGMKPYVFSKKKCQQKGQQWGQGGTNVRFGKKKGKRYGFCKVDNQKRVVVKVVPMGNVDGVVQGNYRCGLGGRDFNRAYAYPSKSLYPQVFHIKQLANKLKLQYQKNLLLFLDFHGHSVKKNVFMYGPQYTITQKGYYQSRIFPKMLGTMTQMFRYYSCVFRIAECKETTARAILLRKLRIPYCYTIQASNGCYFSRESKKDINFEKKQWMQMGVNIGKCALIYTNNVIKSQIVLKNRLLNKKKRKNLSLRVAKKKEHAKKKNDQMGKIIQEIIEAQKFKEEHKISDDQISEGNSDSSVGQQLTQKYLKQLCEQSSNINSQIGKAFQKQLQNTNITNSNTTGDIFLNVDQKTEVQMPKPKKQKDVKFKQFNFQLNQCRNASPNIQHKRIKSSFKMSRKQTGEIRASIDEEKDLVIGKIQLFSKPNPRAFVNQINFPKKQFKFHRRLQKKNLHGSFCLNEYIGLTQSRASSRQPRNSSFIFIRK